MTYPQVVMPVEPIRRVIEELLAGGNTLDEIAARMAAAGGWASTESAMRSLYRVRAEQATVSLDWTDRFLTAVDREDAWYSEGFPPPPAGHVSNKVRLPGETTPRIKRLKRDCKLTRDQIHAAHRLHAEGGLSLRALGKLGWQTWGYSSPLSAANALSGLFRSFGLPVRDRVEASRLASTTHGLAGREDRKPGGAKHAEHLALRASRRRRKRCEGVRNQHPRKGEQCRRYALDGSDFCLQHDPTRRTEVVEIVTAARAKRERT